MERKGRVWVVGEKVEGKIERRGMVKLTGVVG